MAYKNQTNKIGQNGVRHIKKIPPQQKLELQFCYQDLIGVGHRFAHIYDLDKFKSKFAFNIHKKEVVSCFDFQKKLKPIIAMGKFNNSIDLYNTM